MLIFLAGTGVAKTLFKKDEFYKFNRLESYIYISGLELEMIHKFNNFLLDSGAFTFMNQSQNRDIDWNHYVDDYANFIKKHNIKYFFELDIDSIVGLSEVERLRSRLEKKVGRQSIPVWHKSRGIKKYKEMCKEYDYIAVGGIVTKEIKSKDYKIFPYLLQIAKKANCKVHGLGFTGIKELKKYKFYSVDSTTWISGSRFGYVNKFHKGDIIKYKVPKGKRMKTSEVRRHNFYEWVKFANYAEKNL